MRGLKTTYVKEVNIFQFLERDRHTRLAFMSNHVFHITKKLQNSFETLDKS